MSAQNQKTSGFGGIVLTFVKGIWAWLKEMVRKAIVALKRSPQTIPMLMLGAAFVLYSFNLTDMSDSTAKIQGAGMGLCQFCIMLFTLLSMVCLLNSFPRRKKANIPMIVLMFVMFAIVIFCSMHYGNAIMAALTRAESPIARTEYIENAYYMLGTYRVLIIITAVLVALLPVYSKWLRKINTSVEVEDNGDMGAIELND